ncbi:PI31 proteasome regulator [Schizosaccharomyces japonicus yFS275]|uniref:PI31 proteasome regulator n=1 Tax=Schizosaccharomyces japonicus (strain yFS275 / FY16936) TaxID=402676 RepID=B6K7C5_SCHJY|nr:PI31 proteasome regulator [Schizosaccharomyces japonicus yFS275]EEB09429.1 PI31 proteasome regulator [Schizosaccharomyces japonicus yFS275]
MGDIETDFMKKFHNSALSLGAKFEYCELIDGTRLSELQKDAYSNETLCYSVHSHKLRFRLLQFDGWFFCLGSNLQLDRAASSVFDRKSFDDGLWDISDLFSRLTETGLNVESSTVTSSVRARSTTSAAPHANINDGERHTPSSTSPFSSGIRVGDDPSLRFGLPPGGTRSSRFPAIGSDDLNPAGTNAHTPSNDGGMFPTAAHPIFQGPIIGDPVLMGGERNPINGQFHPSPGLVRPPGARYDPTGPNDPFASGTDERHRRDPPRRNMRLPGEPDNDELMPPGADSMFF